VEYIIAALGIKVIVDSHCYKGNRSHCCLTMTLDNIETMTLHTIVDFVTPFK
jgi:hypothetical protein